MSLGHPAPTQAIDAVLAALPGELPAVVCRYCGESYCRYAGGNVACADEDLRQEDLRMVAEAPTLYLAGGAW